MPARLRRLLLASIVLLAASLVAIEGWAQVAYRSHASAGLATTSGTSVTHIANGLADATNSPFDCGESITPETPGGNNADLLIALVVSKDSGNTTLQASTGWSTLFSSNNPSKTSYQARIYYRFATGSANDNLTVSRANTGASGCDVLFGRVARFRGVDPANPFQWSAPAPAANSAFSSTTSVTSGTENTASPTVTPNTLLLFAVLISNDVGTGTPTVAGLTFTELFDSGTANGTQAQVSLKSAPGGAATTYGPYSVTKTGSDPSHGVLIALRPLSSLNESLTITRPGSMVNNDVMVASVAVRPSTIAVTPPTGWTQVRNMTQGAGNTSRMATFIRTVTSIATEPASYQFVLAGGASTGAAGGIIAFSGVDTTALPPAGNEQLGNTTASAMTHTAAQLTTIVANSMLVGSFEFTSTPEAARWSTSATMTDRVNQDSLPPTIPNNDGLRLLMSHQTRAAIGATGSRTATATVTPPGSVPTADTGLAFLLALRPAITINHFSIAHGTSGVACDSQTITITAHDSLHNPVSAQGITVALSTTNNKGTWTGIVSGGGTLSDPTPGDGAASYTFAPGSSSVQLSFRYSNLTATSESFRFNASGGGFSDSSGTATLALDDPQFTMAQAGFQFRNVTDVNTTIPTQIAGKPSDTGFNSKTIRLRAVRTDDSTGACVGLFASQSRTVELGAECNSPATCAARQVSINGTNIATGNDNGATGAAAYTGVSLTFNASSEAPTVISYSDAGQISLHARYDLDTNVAGFEMTGSSNAFVVRPFGLAFRGATVAATIQHSTTESGTPLVAAGDNFTMTLAAYGWASGEDADNNGVPDAGVNITNNITTPNFAAAATVSVSANLPGVALGAISRGATCGNPATITAGSWSASGATLADWCYSEAGNVFLTATVNDYISAGVNVTGNSGLDGTGAAGGYVGRFRPKHFAIAGTPTLTNRSALACAPTPSTFTYMSEGLGLSFMLEARNTQGVRTQNYNGVYAKLGIGTFANFNVGAKSGATDLTTRVDDNSVSPTGAWANGIANVSMTTRIRRATPDNPDGPHTAVQFGIAPNVDGVAMNTLDFDADGNSVNERKSVGPTTVVRFGRLVMGSRNGSQLRPLRIPAETQYWNGTSFLTNVDDSCTTLAANNIALGNYQPNLNACETSVTVAAFAQGRSTIGLSVPGQGNNGSVDLTANLSAANTGSTCIAGATTPVLGANRSYLQGNWTGATYTQNPASRATFGTYPGADEVIFSRENF